MQKTDFPGSARQGTIHFAINGIGYVGLGLSNGSTLAGLADFYSYNPVNTSSWSPIDSLPGDPRENGTSFTIGSCGYIFGGVNFTTSTSGYFYNDLWEYCGTVGIEEQSGYSDISVNYNQNSNTFNLNFNSHQFKKGLLKIYDVQGKCLLSADVYQSQGAFQFNHAKGIYNYRLMLDNRIIKSGKVLN